MVTPFEQVDREEQRDWPAGGRIAIYVRANSIRRVDSALIVPPQ